MAKKILIMMTDVGMPMKNGHPDNSTVEELLGVYHALQKKGHETYLLQDSNSDPGQYRAVGRDVDPNQFDEILINREVPNFYGGVINKKHEWTAKTLMKFRGRVAHYYCDPEMGAGNYLEAFYRKIWDRETAQMEDQSDPKSHFPKDELGDAMKKTELGEVKIYTPYPILTHKILSRYHGKDVEFIDAWREQLFTVREKRLRRGLIRKDPGYEFDSMAYVGSYKPTRHKRLQELGLLEPQAVESGLIKYYGKSSRAIDEMMGKEVKRFGGSLGRIHIDEVDRTYAKHIATLVSGAIQQEDCGLNHRFLQSLLIDRGVIFDAKQDTRGVLVLDPELRDLIYVNSAQDVLDKMADLRTPPGYERVRTLLKKERARILAESPEELQERLNG